MLLHLLFHRLNDLFIKLRPTIDGDSREGAGGNAGTEAIKVVPRDSVSTQSYDIASVEALTRPVRQSLRITHKQRFRTLTDYREE